MFAGRNFSPSIFFSSFSIFFYIKLEIVVQDTYATPANENHVENVFFDLSSHFSDRLRDLKHTGTFSAVRKSKQHRRSSRLRSRPSGFSCLVVTQSKSTVNMK